MYNFMKGRLVVVRLCLLGAALALIAVGIATVDSVGHPAEASPAGHAGDLAGFWQKQLIFAAVALGGFVAVNLVNYNFPAAGASRKDW